MECPYSDPACTGVHNTRSRKEDTCPSAWANMLERHAKYYRAKYHNDPDYREMMKAKARK